MEHSQTNAQCQTAFVMPTPRIPIADSFDATRGDREKVHSQTDQSSCRTNLGYKQNSNCSCLSPMTNLLAGDGDDGVYFLLDNLAEGFKSQNNLFLSRKVLHYVVQL